VFERGYVAMACSGIEAWQAPKKILNILFKKLTTGTKKN